MDNPIELVPVKEFKQQVDERLARDFTSINPAPGIGLDESWNKECPCDDEKEKNTCTIFGYCDGIVSITVRGGRVEGYTLVVLTFRKSHRSYLLQNIDYRDLKDQGNFMECGTEEVWY